MNSQIYCLPQKLGWNSLNLKETSVERTEILEKYLKLRTNRPYPTVKLRGQTPSYEVIREYHRQYPKLPIPDADTEVQALKSVFTTDYNFRYRPDLLPPVIRPPPPVTYDTRADPVKPIRRDYYPPLATLTLPVGTFSNDPDRGLHQWRELEVRPDFGIWQSYARLPFHSYVGQRSTLPPARLKDHDPTHEKERWDSIRNLTRQNAISYGYRVDMTGYTGHKQRNEHIFSQVEKDVSQPSNAMESTTQVTYRDFPEECYLHLDNQAIHKHLGPLARIVTLTQPYNPFSQQAAHCNPLGVNMPQQ